MEAPTSQSRLKRIISNPMFWIFIIMTFWIFATSLIHFRGRVSNDGGFYLDIARHFAQGTIYVDGRFITTWPAGWPLSIAIFKTILFADTWLASKIALLFYFSMSSLLIIKIFKENHLPAVFLFAAYLFIFHDSNSEAQFIFFELLCFYLTLNYLETEKNYYLYLLPLATAGAYFTRYYGLYTLAFYAYIFFRHLQMRRGVVRVILVGTISLLFPIGYMFLNQALAGDALGPRPASEASLFLFSKLVIEAISTAANPFIDKIGYRLTLYIHLTLLPLFILVLIFFRKKIFHKPVIEMVEADRLLIFTTLAYVVPMLGLRFFKYFSMDTRMLAPGALFIWLFVLRRMNRKFLYLVCALALVVGSAKVGLHSIMVKKKPFICHYIESKKTGEDIVDVILKIRKSNAMDNLIRDDFRDGMQDLR